MNKVIFNPYRTIYVSPPGDTLLDVLEEQELTIEDFAVRVGEPVATINQIIAGKTAITPEIASKFETVLDISANFWNNRERNYREALAKQTESRYIPDQLETVSVFAFLEALRRSENALTPELQSQINQLGQILVTETKDALASLRNLAADNSIKDVYQQVCQEINQQYQIQPVGDRRSKTDNEDTEVFCELLGVLVDVLDAPDAQEEAKELAPELDKLYKRLFKLVVF